MALEGASRNIKVNTVAPFAASRMTETVLPPVFLEKLKPESVAPFVLYLCHEDCKDSGNLFEVGCGWAAKLRWERAAGGFFDEDGFTPEGLKAGWGSIVKFDENSEYPDSAQHAFGNIMKNMEKNGVKL